MEEIIPRATYRSRQELIDAGLHSHISSDAYCKDDPETCVFSVLSGCHKNSCHSKDMGGLLQEGGRDFLVYQLGLKTSRAMWASKRLGRHVHVIRQVRIPQSLHLTPPMPSESTSHSTRISYMYCGKYEIVDGWRATAKDSCFKLSRLPEQPDLVPQQMVFRSNKAAIANSFQLTRQAYEFALQKDCSQPCERINARDGSGINVAQDAMLAEYCLCDVCGMSGSRTNSGAVKMQVCGTCLDNGKETLACPYCVPWELRCWLNEDPDSRHWRCAHCRLAGLRPCRGAIFDEQASSTQAHCCELLAASAGTLNQQDVIELSDSDSHSEELKHEVASVSTASQHLSHDGRPETPEDIQRKSARIIRAPKRFNQAGCPGRQQKRRTEAPSVVQQLDNHLTLAASMLQPATAVQVHMHPKLGVSSAQLPAASVALPTTGGVSMTSAAAAALMHTSQLPSDTVAELATLAAAPSWSLQANPHQASRQLQLQKWPSASKAGTVAAPLSALLPNMPLQTPDKPLLPATGALFQGNSLQTNLSAQLSQQAGTAAATLHSPSSRLLSLHTSASASLEIPARVSPGSLPVAEAQGTATTVAPEPKPASAMPALGTPPPAILANPPLQAPIMSAAPAIPSPMRYSALKEGSAESPPRTSPSATVAMPVCITQVVCRMNGLMGPQQQMHHITEAQAAHLDEVFGDVEVLLDLASMDDKPLNRALRCDGKLNAVQIVSMRRLLRTILHQSNS
ncbi:hypothetical protein WJX77_007740 [Trebouxia sp. C0004]